MNNRLKSFLTEASSDGLMLSTAVTEPYGTPCGVIQFIHGMCEHKERYFPFMEFLSSKGYVCVINDLRGHGASVKSPSDLGFLYGGGWRAMVEDERLICDMAHKEYPGLPYTLFGHSMGSMAARSFVKRYDDKIDMLIVCGSPSYNRAAPAGKALARLIALSRGGRHRPELLRKMSFGAYNRPFGNEGYPAAWVCSDRNTLEAYHSDPLCQYVFTANGFINLLGLMSDCYSGNGWKVSNPSMPIHFISGADDPCRISDKAHAASVELMKRAGYKNIDSRLYSGMRHEILNETDRMTVWNDILKYQVEAERGK